MTTLGGLLDGPPALVNVGVERLRRAARRARRGRRPPRLAPAGRRRRRARPAPRRPDRRRAHRGGQRRGARADARGAPALGRRRPARATCCPRSTRSACCSTPGRRSPTRTCAGRCAPASSAPRCSRAGPTRPRRPSGMAAAGEIAFAPCHHHDAVGPMAGIISASMPLIVAEDPATGRARLLEPQRGRRALPALRRARRRRHGAPALDERAPRPVAPRRAGRARRADRPQGDHRPGAADGRRVPQPQRRVERAARPARSRPGSPATPTSAAAEALDFLRTNDYWFLNFSMVASKLGTMAGARRGGLDGRDDLRAATA